LISSEELTDFLSSKDLPRREKVLLILAYNSTTSLSLADIKRIAINHGLREIEKWNVADILLKAKGLAVRVPDGWKLTGRGVEFIKTEFQIQEKPTAKDAAIQLRSHLAKVQNSETREFIEESIKCLENDLYRSAVVMSWVGAMSILYDYVILNRLSDFNTEAKRRKTDWKSAITKDDLALMKESEFMDILANLSLIGKNTKEHLKNNCLNLRNSCGHPSSLKIGKHTVEAHLEFLILNIYEKY
jgi:hypothetical protein